MALSSSISFHFRRTPRTWTGNLYERQEHSRAVWAKSQLLFWFDCFHNKNIKTLRICPHCLAVSLAFVHYFVWVRGVRLKWNEIELDHAKYEPNATIFMSFLGEIFDCIQNFHEKSYPAPISLHKYLMVQLCPERVSKISFAGSWNQTKNSPKETHKNGGIWLILFLKWIVENFFFEKILSFLKKYLQNWKN